MLRHLHCLVYKHFKITSEVNYTYDSISRSHVTFLVLSKSLYLFHSYCHGPGFQYLHKFWPAFHCAAEAPWCKRLFYSSGS